MATCNVYHDKRREKKKGLYPIKIRVTHERKTKYFDTVFAVSEGDFIKIQTGNRVTDELRKVKIRIEKLLKKAEEVIWHLEYFDFEAFTIRFKDTGDRNDLIYLLRSKAKRLKEEKFLSNSNLYAQAANLLERFVKIEKKSSKLLIRDLTPDLLKSFQRWALNTNYIIEKNRANKERKYSVTTIGMYLIRIKAIINGQIEAGLMRAARSPFGKGKYIIPKSRVSKRPLEKQEIIAIANYETDDPKQIFARDMFIFSYLANGMNFFDIFMLKWNDIKNDAFYFVRQKTYSKLPDKQIRVFINHRIQHIIDTHGIKKENNPYIFDIVPARADIETATKKIRTQISLVNLSLKQIAKALNVTQEISTYYARHTFATMMHELGASLYTIKDVIGHEDIKSTQVYVSGEKKERLMELQNRLLEDEII